MGRNKKSIALMMIFLILTMGVFTSCDNKTVTNNTTAPITKDIINSDAVNVGKILEIKNNEDKSGVTLRVELIKGSFKMGDSAKYTDPDNRKVTDIEIGGLIDKDSIVNQVNARGKFDVIIFGKKSDDFKTGGSIEVEKTNDKKKAITTPIGPAPKKSN